MTRKTKMMPDLLRQWRSELEKLETALLDPRVRSNPQQVEDLLAADFVEFGTSGRTYNKETLIAMMADETRAPVLIRDFSVRALSPTVALVTYRTVGQAGRAARRSSIWVRTRGSWRMTFHQGTLLPNRWGPVA